MYFIAKDTHTETAEIGIQHQREAEASKYNCSHIRRNSLKDNRLY